MNAKTIKVATFNASMDGSNYVAKGEKPKGNELVSRLATGHEQQIKNIAEIIQRVRPDILLMNEFDYIADSQVGVEAFLKNYLKKTQSGQSPIDYHHYFVAPVNTGVPMKLDANGDGNSNDVFGFGHYPGQYGMLLLSRYPIDTKNVRTFQRFLWKDMPDNLLVEIKDENGVPWYRPQGTEIMRLSSKSHWDIPVNVDGEVIHVLASHPTPPVFDGPENRNGKRNHDEVRFWVDYLNKDAYFYDDQGKRGGFTGRRFVIVGDLNSSMVEGDSYGDAIKKLLMHPLVNQSITPTSAGGKKTRKDNPYSESHTAAWGMRADYVLPSVDGFNIEGGAVYWPEKESAEFRLVADRSASSDHRLVWLKLSLRQ
nr:endonuclease/exonuclease/phosphatase family protein [Alteromonas sp. a30]